jgi:hypothetical protein
MRHRVLFALACVLFASPDTSHAQDGANQAGPELTPYVFLGSNASSGFGTAVRWP